MVSLAVLISTVQRLDGFASPLSTAPPPPVASPAAFARLWSSGPPARGSRLPSLRYHPPSRHTHPPLAQSGTAGHVGHGKIGARVSERVYLLPPSAAQLAAVLPRCIAVKAAVSQPQQGVHPPNKDGRKGVVPR